MGIVCQNRAEFGHLGIIGAIFGHYNILTYIAFNLIIFFIIP